MKRFLEQLTKKQIIIAILSIVSFLLFVVLRIFGGIYAASDLSQQMVKRWGEDGGNAQISCFFANDAAVDADWLFGVGKSIEKALLEASISLPPEQEGGRLWADAYSASGQITVTRGAASLTANAVGIGGDFFLFHPLHLLEGAYFTGNDLMTDSVIIDEDAAWQLFGSNDVVGMQVYISEVPHLITGVIKRDSKRLDRAAGLAETTIYISYNSLSRYGITPGISTYEIIMPNPITSFAYDMVKDKIGIDEQKFTIVENSKRFSFVSVLLQLKNFGSRSMSFKNIIYPYWENKARGMEDVLTLMLILEFLFLILPVIIVVYFIRKGLRCLSRNKMNIWHGFKRGIRNLGYFIKERIKKKASQDSLEEESTFQEPSDDEPEDPTHEE